MIQGFRDTDGICVPFADIDYIRDAKRFNTSPATLAMLLDHAKGREFVDFSASQLGTTTRQHVLRSRDYYPNTSQMMSAYVGTVKHQQVNVMRDRLIVEQRYVSKRDSRLSAQIDHAAIVDVIYAGDDGNFERTVVDVTDMKNTKWYSVTLMWKDLWKHHPEYGWQVNLQAALMEENGYLVRNLYLECIPADGTYKHQAEADRLGIPEYQKVIIPVERKSADETYAVYFAAMKLRDEAIAAGRAPLCSDRWSNKLIDNLRCRHYCDVKDECIAMSHDNGESHPIAPLDVALAASIAGKPYDPEDHEGMHP